MIRTHYLEEINFQLQVQPICALLGPRQVGKTTLAKMYAEKYFPNNSHFFDLENPFDLKRLENPMLALTSIPQKLIVIDEIQRRPELFPILRVIADMPTDDHIFLILGSASRDLIHQSSETLAGRIGYIELPPFSLFEVKDSKRLFLRGGFPLSYLAENDDKSYAWRQNYISTFLERDIPNLGFNIPAHQLWRFWLMLAHYHGQIFNASEIGKSLAVSHPTVRSYLDILNGTFMIRILYPWFENIHKRQVKSPKVYFRDNGILNALVGISTELEALTHPRLGSFWEGFALEEVIRSLNVPSSRCYFWSTHSEAELDLLIFKGTKRLGFEFKYTDAPKVGKSMHIAQKDLALDSLIVVYPGSEIFPLTEKIFACGIDAISTDKFKQCLP